MALNIYLPGTSNIKPSGHLLASLIIYIPGAFYIMPSGHVLASMMLGYLSVRPKGLVA